MKRTLALCCLLILGLLLSLGPMAAAPELMRLADLEALESPSARQRYGYGDDWLNYGNLRLPDQYGPHPVIVMIHGGCWLSDYDLQHLSAAEQALADAGYAVWSIEHRRVGAEGGGWPGTFQDVGQAVDYLRVLDAYHPLDLDRVVVSGHSAGGALATWAAGRSQLSETSELYTARPFVPGAVVGLAPANDIEAIEMADLCGDSVNALMGGTMHEQPERYRDASPMQLLPLGVPQVLVLGARDSTWLPTGESYLARAKIFGDPITAVMLPDAGHFEMIAPTTREWPRVLEVFDTTFAQIDALAAQPAPAADVEQQLTASR